MTEQQYRVIADRDKGDDLRGYLGIMQSGEHVVMELGLEPDYKLTPIRIERAVSTSDEPKRVPEASCFRTEPHGPHYWGQYQGDKYTKHCLGLGSERAVAFPQPPTREQIAEALYSFSGDWRLYRIPWSEQGHEGVRKALLDRADAVLALLQRGAADD